MEYSAVTQPLPLPLMKGECVFFFYRGGAKHMSASFNKSGAFGISVVCTFNSDRVRKL